MFVVYFQIWLSKNIALDWTGQKKKEINEESFAIKKSLVAETWKTYTKLLNYCA